jgi:predicted RND superfamily exporter protein
MVPSLIPIWRVLGLMGWLGIPLDDSSLPIGCIIVGRAFDDTISRSSGCWRASGRSPRSPPTS